MKKKLFAFIFAVILCFSSGIGAFALGDAADKAPFVLDGAMLLTDSEKKDVENKLAEISEANGIDFAVATVSDEELGWTDITVYTDGLYENVYRKSGADGTVILVYEHGAEGEREVCIVCYGEAKEKFSESEMSDVVDDVKSEIISGDYAEAFSVFAEKSDKILNPKISWVWLPICLAVGFVIAFIIIKSIASANKSVRVKANATEYVRMETLNISNSSEQYLYSHTSVTPKSSSNNRSSGTPGGGVSVRSGKF